MDEEIPSGIYVIGPPLSGTTTQGKRLAHKLDYVHISTGDLIRVAAKSRADDVSSVGEKLRWLARTGKKADDELMMMLLDERMGLPDARSALGFVVDGAPYGVGQIEPLEWRIRPELVVSFMVEAPYKVLFDRNTPGRREHDSTDADLQKRIEMWHMHNSAVRDHYRRSKHNYLGFPIVDRDGMPLSEDFLFSAIWENYLIMRGFDEDLGTDSEREEQFMSVFGVDPQDPSLSADGGMDDGLDTYVGLDFSEPADQEMPLYPDDTIEDLFGDPDDEEY